MDEEKGDAFAIPDFRHESLFAGAEAPGCAPEVDGLSPFSTLLLQERTFVADNLGFCADLEPDDRMLFLREIPTALPTLEFSSEDPLQTSKSCDVEPDDGSMPFIYGPLEAIESLEQSSISSEEGREDSDDIVEDVWSGKDILEPIATQAQINGWETIHAESIREFRQVYPSEAGPRLYGAASSREVKPGINKTDDHQPSATLDSDAVLSSVVQLALGRESLLYQYNKDKARFQPAEESIRMSGYASENFNDLIKDLVSCGSHIRRLKDYFETMQRSRKALASSVALASGIHTIVSTLEAQMSGPLASVKTLPQLQALVIRPGSILRSLSSLLDLADNLEDDDDILSVLFDFAQDLEHSAAWYSPIFNQLVDHVSRPWLESIEAAIGLNRGHTLRTTCLNAIVDRRKEHLVDTVLGAALEDGEDPRRRMPKFISSSMSETILENEESLRLLQVHQPGHTLVRPQPVFSVEPLSLQWHSSWQDIEIMEAQVQAYEHGVLQALKDLNSSGTFDPPKKSVIEEFPEVPLHCSVEPDVSNLLAHTETPFLYLFQTTPSPLSTTVSQTLSTTLLPHNNPSDSFTSLVQPDSPKPPPLSLVPTLSFGPMLTAQSRLLSHSTLQLLCRTHTLRSHLRLLHSYLLFADGPFLVHLSHALFDPTLSSAAYQKGRIQAETAGLQLGSRASWPPASSELRITLVGILSESYHSSFPKASVVASRDGNHKRELPGGLNFAIRNDMTDAELEKCMDADGLEALDFLKIQYKPPKPLDVVITDAVLEKYAKISRLLLRGARVGWAVKEMLKHRRGSHRERRGSGLMQRFKIEARQFVTTVFGYFGDAIEELWVAFEQRLDCIEASIDHYEVGRKVEGLYRLRDLHEEVLDRILAACLLRTRQKLVMDLLEEILRLVLQLAKCARERSNDEGDGGEEEIKELYEQWRMKVRVFVTVCRGLQDEKNVVARQDLFDGGKRGEEQGNGIGRLVLALEMNGWYMR
ncbi:MAG: hypothetical protein L6R40_003249 [Gallowayella cf. fulva]|nr:MAG: hypothetical protein L6R40_003249 [Xanthomendoza cf. fulva]